MDVADLNLLPALDALLTEGSVTRAARRLGLSASATSRTLARLRTATGDPLLVRAGRGMVPTPHALALRDRVHALTRQVQEVLRPPDDQLDLATLERTFILRASEGFIRLFSAPLVSAVLAAAPRARLRFAPKPVNDAGPLREGAIDIEIGVLGDFAPEVRTCLLFRDRFLAVVRAGHPLVSAPITADRYAAAKHVVVSRQESATGPVDEALAALGLRREIAVVVPGFPDAMRIARHSDLVALILHSCLGDASLMDGCVSFELPVATPDITVSALWHPRMEADPAHRWLRGIIMSVCRSPTPSS